MTVKSLQNACQLNKIYYQALLDKNSEYEGVFFVGVKTTGVFCRPTCSARKPKFTNCEFFKSAKEALLASFRPCMRCKPLLSANQTSAIMQQLITAVENYPEKRWKDKDFKELGIDASTIRRQFKKKFNMTFVEYARARRMGLAMKQIREGQLVIEAQLSSGYESDSGFRDAFSRIMGAPPSLIKETHQVLKAAWLDSPLGPMLAIADEQALYLLEFVDRRGLEREIERLRMKTKSAIIPGYTDPIYSIEKELKLYYEGQVHTFYTRLAFIGTPFQCAVWHELKKIPAGETCTYSEIAKRLGNPLAVRAVARANGANQLALIIPCHRVIGADGKLTGYGGGLARKKWLIDHEKNINKQNR